eukprot:765212-Hanusia_phi.AAC.6
MIPAVLDPPWQIVNALRQFERLAIDWDEVRGEDDELGAYKSSCRSPQRSERSGSRRRAREARPRASARPSHRERR